MLFAADQYRQVSNTSSINYLILIEQVDLLPAIFQEIVIPQVVYHELSDEAAPPQVKTWLANRPEWLKVIKRNYSLSTTAPWAFVT